MASFSPQGYGLVPSSDNSIQVSENEIITKKARVRLNIAHQITGDAL